MSGTLFICGTPIGNIEDITLRVIRTLREVDLIAAEDTRQTIKLLNYYEIQTPLTSYHEHNKRTKGNDLINKLKDGKNIAIVTDAGMPCISDPGEDLVKLCFLNNITVTVCPGATAGISALALSALPSRRFVFEGFLPDNKKESKKVLERLKKETRTIIFYESPHDLISTLKLLAEFFPERQGAIIREITKKHEQIVKDTIQHCYDYFLQHEPRGEFVILIEGIDEEIIIEEEKAKWDELTIEEHMEIYLKQGLLEKEAMKLVAKDRGVGKREIYHQIKGNESD